jgi:hypothetical protein
VERLYPRVTPCFFVLPQDAMTPIEIAAKGAWRTHCLVLAPFFLPFVPLILVSDAWVHCVQDADNTQSGPYIDVKLKWPVTSEGTAALLHLLRAFPGRSLALTVQLPMIYPAAWRDAYPYAAHAATSWTCASPLQPQCNFLAHCTATLLSVVQHSRCCAGNMEH